MPRVPFHLVDVFGAQRFTGNGICVVTGPCPEPFFQLVARQMNLSETTFATVTSDHTYFMRIFTTTHEIPFVGSASLATAWVLGEGTWTQTTTGATVSVTVDGNQATMNQPSPLFENVDANAAFSKATGGGAFDHVVHATLGGLTALIGRTTQPLDKVTIDQAAIASVLSTYRASTFAICNPPSGDTISVRAFVPDHATFEIPGHGSLATSLGVLAHTQWSAPVAIAVQQGMFTGQPCVMHVHGDPLRPSLGGNLQLVGEGDLLI